MTARAKVRRGLFALLELALLAAPGLAFAHAPAQATQLCWPSGAGRNGAVIRTNRGVLFAGGARGNFEFLCNEAYESPVAETPPLAVRSDGSVLVASYELGLVAGSSNHCGLEPVAGELAGVNLIALQANPAAADDFFALTLPADGSASAVFRSTGPAGGFRRLARIEGAPSSLEVAGAMPSRLYAVSMRSQGEDQIADILSSSDSAETFDLASSMVLDRTEVRAYAAGVDPRDPARLFVRTQSFDGVTPERLLVSLDAGRTFDELFSAPGPLSVLASTEGKKLWVGGADGIWRSADGGRTFGERSISDLTRVGCLAEHDGELFACAYREGAFGVLASRDDGHSWEWYARMADVTTRPACAAESAEGRACEAPFRHFQDEVALTAAPLGGSAGSAPVSTAGGESVDRAPDAGAVSGGAASGIAPNRSAGAPGCTFSRASSSPSDRHSAPLMWLSAVAWMFVRWRRALRGSPGLRRARRRANARRPGYSPNVGW